MSENQAWHEGYAAGRAEAKRVIAQLQLRIGCLEAALRGIIEVYDGCPPFMSIYAEEMIDLAKAALKG